MSKKSTEQSVQTTFLIEADNLAALRKLAVDLHTTASALVRELINEGLPALRRRAKDSRGTRGDATAAA